MNAIMNKTNSSKRLLAAIVAIAMIVCAIAVIMPADSVQAEALNDNTSGVEATDIASEADLLELDANSDGIITIDKPTVYNITGEVGTADNPVDVKFELNSDLRITGVGSLYVQPTGPATDNVYTIHFKTTDSMLIIDGTTVSLDVAGGKDNGTSVFNSQVPGSLQTGVKVTNGATLNIYHTGSGTTWLAPTTAGFVPYLIVDGNSVVNFNGTHAIQEIIVDADNATINFNDVLVGPSIFAGSTFDNSSMNVNGADLNGIFVKGDITLTNSTFNVVNTSRTNADRPGLMIANQTSTKITMDDKSSISASTIGVTDQWDGYTDTNTAVNIAGGKITGEFTAPLSAADTPTTTAPAYNLDGTTIDGRSTIASGATVTGSVDVASGANLSVYGKLATTTTNNEGTISIMDKNASIPEAITGTGSVDTSAITGYEEISGEIYDVTTKGVGQTTTVVGDTVILEGSSLTIKGKLIINEGVTLTIEDGAQLVLEGSLASIENNGTILVQSDVTKGSVIGKTEDPTAKFQYDGGLVVASTATLENNGTIVADYALLSEETVSSNVVVIGSNSTLKNNGTVTINDDNIMYVSGTFINGGGSTLNINGTFTGYNGNVSNIDNAGTVNIDGTIANVTIYLTSQDATVSIVSLQVTNGKLTIDDSKVTSSRADTVVDEGYNSIEISSQNGTVGGISVKTSLVVKDDVYYRNMDLSGTIVYTYTGNSQAGSDDDAAVTLNNTVNAAFVVTGTLTVGENVDVTLDGNLDVSGTMTMQKDSTAAKGATANVTVSGTVVSAYELTNWTMNAAMYRTMDGTTPTYYYTTLENAISSGATAITVTGNIVVKSDVTIPSGTTVTQKNGEIQIGDSDNNNVTVEVATGGKIDQKDGTIAVKGTLFIENKSNGISRNADITSEVMSETDTSVTYTNLANAIANAGSEPVTITLNGGVEITSDLTIPSNVTVDTNEKTFTVTGATLTIDGTLYLNGTTPGSEYVVKDTTGNVVREGKVVLNGYIKSNENLAYTDGKTLPAGAYYIGAEDSLDYITSVNNSPNIIASAEDMTIDIYGTNTAGDISYTGTADQKAVINVNGKMTVSGITLLNADLVFKLSQEFDGTISTAEGAVEFTDATIIGTFTSASKDGAMVFEIVDANIGYADAKGYEALFTGASTISGQIYGMTVEGNVTASGLTATNVTVSGTLTVANGKSLAVNGIAAVYGTLEAAAATDSAAAGSATVNKLYVGAEPEKLATESENAVVSGSITAYIAYVVNGCTVTDSIIDSTGVKSTEFYIEDALWMTAYTANGISADVSNAPVENADFNGWKDENGDMAYYVTAPQAGGDLASDITVGTPAKLYADIDYNIYSVEVVADNGIGTVAIDGIVMTNVSGNTFTLSGLTAGEHTLSYTLKNGYEGTAMMSINGQSVSGYKFTLSGTDDADRNIEITLSGTTPSDNTVVIEGGNNGASDSLGLTDYLLIVLVILIVIMAIIVAMRLMRS